MNCDSFLRSSTDRTQQAQIKTIKANYQPGAAAGLSRSAQAAQPSMLCDHQPTADDFQHPYPNYTCIYSA